MKRYKQANQDIRLPEDLAARTAADTPRKSAAPRRVIALATAAALLIGAVAVGTALVRRDDTGEFNHLTFGPDDTTQSPALTTDAQIPTETTEQISGLLPLQLTKVSHPEQAQYPLDDVYLSSPEYELWRKEHNARLKQPEGYDEGVHEASVALMQQFLPSTAESEGQNRVLSPLNLYLALAMLTEATDTTSRAALLDLLGADSIDTLRSRVASIWNVNYVDDGRVTSRLAASLWLADRLSYRADTLECLAKNHYAETYQGKMGTEEMNAALRSWLNKNTGNLLTEQANGVSFDPLTVLGLATTIYYKASWDNSFSSNLTADDTFHTTSGDITVSFMHDSEHAYCYWGDGFTATYRSLGDGKMWLILPDEGVSPDQLIEAGDIFTLTQDFAQNWSDKKHLRVNLSLPKFDVVSDMDLTTGLAELGLGDLFNPACADFSPITDDPALQDQLALSQAKHAARVKIDEEGCEAAAYTVMVLTATGAIIADEIDFVLDRPFIFIVTGSDNATLFAGVVETP
ncbi:MAG: hypothetical protein IJF49_08725 [Clostridia bacterium]|nr:hypothetical protein [Clostridia bacterium]